jgi:hypothetical protein
MTTETTPPAPQLDRPGAGLPRIELLVARALTRFRFRLTSRAKAGALIATERMAVGSLARDCGAERSARRVLIKRLPGLEDSSRYWSILMTVDHLRIVNRNAAATIRSLLAGRIPVGEASTAAVKPSPDVDATVIAAFEQSCDEITQSCREAPSLRTEVRYPHPWFGPLNAEEWQALAGFHMTLHRRQMGLILTGLDQPVGQA